MNKRISKVITAVLIMSLVFTSGSFAFADSKAPQIESKAGKVSESQQSLGASEISVKPLEGSALAAGDVKSIKPSATVDFLTTMKTGKEKLKYSTLRFGSGDALATGLYGAGKVYELKKGTVIKFKGANTQSTATGPIMMGVFDLSFKGKYQTVTKGQAFSEVAIVITETGNYFVGAISTTNPGADQYAASMYATKILPGDRTIKNKQSCVVAHGGGTPSTYFKFTATKTGYLKVATDSSGKVTLLKGNKKTKLSKTISMSPKGAYFGVKKGTTYYIKRTALYTQYGSYFRLWIANNAISEKSGSTKSKAVTIAKKKTKKGSITAGSGTADWYKFKVPTNKKTVMTLKGVANDSMKVTTIVKKGGHTITRTFNYRDYHKYYQFKMTNYKGYTCYVKVVRGSKYSSGYYSLNWK